MNHVKRILLSLISCGWVVPACFAVVTWIDYVQLEIQPRLAGQVPGNSFPFLGFVRESSVVACIWLGLVIAVWSWIAGRRLQSRA